MIQKLSILFILFAAIHISVLGQDKAVFSDKKPLIDTTVKSKGLFGGRVETGLEKGVEKVKNLKKESAEWKKESKAFIEEMGLNNLGKKSAKLVKNIKKKIIVKDEYEGVKTEKRLGQYGSGNRAGYEEINVVKYVEDEAINPYNQEIWWFDPAQSRIVNSSLKDNKTAQICHGPFKRYLNQVLVEQGYFYMGAKDGRWENYGPEFELENKQYFKRGLTAESSISYYDIEKKKIKEVIPKVYGKIVGQYLSFFPSGLMKEEGKFDDSVKIGRWREFHEKGTGGRLKKEWRFGKDKFDTQEGILIQERDNQSKIIFQNPQKFD
ncbi:toxin-antitoxin system YwqK family antitoxin [Aquirufa sp. ROCK2-A2]